MKIGDYETHPLADCLPLMEGDVYDDLVKDIKANGLRLKIARHKGRILDGRNRLRACLDAGVEPQFDDLSDEDAFDYVYSLNIPRRHLTQGQRVLVISGWSTLARGQHVKDPKDLSAQAAALGISDGEVKRAKAVLASGNEEIIAAVASGEMSLKDANAKVPHREYKKRDATAGRPPPNRPRAADLASMVNAALREGGCQTRYTNTTSEHVEMRVHYDGRVYVLRLELEQ